MNSPRVATAAVRAPGFEYQVVNNHCQFIGKKGMWVSQGVSWASVDVSGFYVSGGNGSNMSAHGKGSNVSGDSLMEC